MLIVLQCVTSNSFPQKYQNKIEGKSTRELLVELSKHGSLAEDYDLIRSALVVASMEDLESLVKQLCAALDVANQTNRLLSTKLLWLNLALTSATLVGALATALIAYKTFWP